MLAWEGPQQAVWLERLKQEYANLQAAMQWSLEQGEERGRMEVAFRFGAALRSFWQVRGYLARGASSWSVFCYNAEAACHPCTRRHSTMRLLAVSQGDHAWGEVLCQEKPGAVP